MAVIIVQVSRCTSLTLRSVHVMLKISGDFIPFTCSNVVYMFTVLNDAMEFQTNIDDFVVNQHALAYNFDTRQ